ncbi:MAG: hydrogenase 1 large subunit, partial [Nitrospirae bacterium]
LKQLGVGPEVLFSTLGRTAARGVETLVVAEMLPVWIGELAENMKKGDLRIHNSEKWDPSTWPKEAQGYGWHEAPRGALGHWVRIKDGKIENYQIVVPSTWNGSPRDAMGQRGPYEEALIGTPVADPDKPIEVLRTIHSFDPCMACAVHVVDGKGKLRAKIRLN